MWSNVRLLNLASNALFALSALMIAAWGLHALVRSPAFPLRVIEVGERLEQGAGGPEVRTGARRGAMD